MGGTNLLRKPAKQRTVALWKDQETDIALLSAELGQDLSYTDLVREGVDIVLRQLRDISKTKKAMDKLGKEE